MSEMLSDEQLASMRLYPERSHVRDLVDSHRALHAQLAQVTDERDEALKSGYGYMTIKILRAELTAAQQRVDEKDSELGKLDAEIIVLKAKVAALENAIRNEPELPGEIPQEMFETIKTLDKQGLEEWCRIIVRKTKESILRNA